jgi:Domain of unknown function (DUF4395)
VAASGQVVCHARRPGGSLARTTIPNETGTNHPEREPMEKVATGMKIDPRGQRFSAALSTVVLAVVLVTGSVWLLAFQAVVFGIGAVAGMAYAPYGMIYRWLVRPRLGPPIQMEDAAGPRFAQGVGLVVSIIGVIGYATGLTPLGMAGTALALAAAFLNAVFGLCLGCEMYVLIRRIWPRQQGAAPAEPDKEVIA